MINRTPDDVFESFFKETILNEDGSINLEAVKKELFDYYYVSINTATVYAHITNGNFAKPNTDAKVIIECAEDYYAEHYHH